MRGGSSPLGKGPPLVRGPPGGGSRPNAVFGTVSSNVMTWGSLSRDDGAHSLSHVSPHPDGLVLTIWGRDRQSCSCPSRRGSSPSGGRAGLRAPLLLLRALPWGSVLSARLHSFMLLSSGVKLVGDLTLFLDQVSKFGATVFHVQKVCLY